MFVPRKDRGETLWTVGYYVHNDEHEPIWFPMKDFSTAMEAWRFIHYLNGGGDRVLFSS